MLAEHADGPAHVLGFSLGGFIACMLALRHPELVRSLVLAGTSVGGPGSTPVPRSTLDVWLEHAGEPPADFARATMWLSFAPGWSDEHPDRYEEILRARLEHPTPPAAWRAQYDAAAVFLEHGAPVERIEVPALVVHGEVDRIMPLENGRVIARRLPRGRLVELSGRGHLAALEAPDEFNAAVLTFLAEADATGPASDTDREAHGLRQRSRPST